MYKPGRIRSPRWRDIALHCSHEAKTVPAIAQEMGVDSGSIQSLVRSMRRENLLEVSPSQARGVAFKLTKRGHAELKKHDAAGPAEGLLAPGQRLVFVIEEARGISADALADLAADPSFRWAARIDGTVRWIASFGQDDAAAAERAASIFADAGARAVVGRSDEFFDAAGLVEFVARMRRPRQRLGARQALDRRKS